VFVSSVVDGFAQFREAARRGIVKSEAEPVLVNENFPAETLSSRTACLDAVASCDAFALIIGQRGGWTTPSGKLVVEEEYEEAIARRIPVLVFVQTEPHDAEADRLIKRVSDYVDGRFRHTFSSAHQLEEAVAASVAAIVPMLKQPTVSASDFQMRLSAKPRIQSEPMIRLIIGPERDEELISPVTLMSPTFPREILRLGHEGAAPLLDFGRPKAHKIVGAAIVIEQTDPEARHGSTDLVRFALNERGVIDIDANIPARDRPVQDVFAAGMIVRVSDITDRLRAMFAFAVSFYESRDPYKRHHRFLYNAALLGLGYRKLTRQREERGPYAMNMMRGDEPIIAYSAPRLVSREQLARPDDEIARIVALFERADRE
jgi:hypothetical protein